MTSCYNKPLRTGSIIKSFLILLIIAVFIVSCEEEPTNIGSDVLLESDFDNIVATDTFSVELYTMFSDKARSIFPPVSYLGSIIDPYFGLTSADFVTQLWLSGSWPGDGFDVDSVKLTLDIYDVSGVMSEGIAMIYEIDEMLDADSSYIVTRDVPVVRLLGTFSFPVLPEGSDTIVSVSLPASFGEYILRDTTKLFLQSDTSDFRSYLKGVYFDYPQLSDYHMIKLNTLSNYTNIIIYYTNAAGISRSFRLTINDNCIQYNRYFHDFDYADPDKRIQYINESVQDTLAYAQAKDGVYIRLVIPGLEDLKEKMPISINKARLFLPAYINDIDYTEEMIPEYLVTRYDSAGYKSVISDYLLNPSFMDGSYNQIDNLFKLNISNFVQQYLEGEIDKPEIEIYLNEFNSKNLILRNGDGENSVRFELSYTDLN